jgi:N-acetylmuramoyl-L-alanine amidase
MRKIERIFVHCTAGSQKTTLKQLENEFKAKGWKSPGYHYVVFPDGKIEQMLDESKVSNGVRGFNSTSINVSYVGGVDSKLKPIDNRTEAQKASLIKILTELKTRYPEAKIMGHRDVWGKDPKKWQKWCPCFDAESEYAEIGKVKEEPKDQSTKIIDDLFFEKNVQAGNGLLDQIKTPVQEPISHETLIKRIFKFLTSWIKKG